MTMRQPTVRDLINSHNMQVQEIKYNERVLKQKYDPAIVVHTKILRANVKRIRRTLKLTQT